MNESATSTERKPTPPTPEQLDIITNLANVLSPANKESTEPRAPTSANYKFVDDAGTPRDLTVTNYQHAPHPDEPETLLLVNDAGVHGPFTATHYRLVKEGKGTALKIVELDLSMLTTTYLGTAGDFSKLASAAQDKLDSQDIASELGVDSANFDQAQDLIKLLQLARDPRQERSHFDTLSACKINQS